MDLSKGDVVLFFREINSLIDNGHKESITKIHELAEDYKTIEYLYEKYNVELYLSPVTDKKAIDEFNKILEDYSCNFRGNDGKKFEVEHNGLCLLAAWAFDMVINWELTCEAYSGIL